MRLEVEIPWRHPWGVRRVSAYDDLWGEMVQGVQVRVLWVYLCVVWRT